MRKFVLFISVALFSSAACCAPPSTESVDHLLAVTKSETIIDGMLVNIEQSMRQGMATAQKGQQITAEQQRSMDLLPAKFAKVFREAMNWASMRPMFVQIYQESYTQEEVDGLVAFYQSPIGVAYIEKMPIVMQKSMTLVQTRMGPMMEKMQAALKQAMEEAKTPK